MRAVCTKKSLLTKDKTAARDEERPYSTFAGLGKEGQAMLPICKCVVDKGDRQDTRINVGTCTCLHISHLEQENPHH